MSKNSSKAATGTFGRVVVARVMPGCDLLEALERIVIQQQISGGVILSGIGTLTEARLHAARLLTYDFPYPEDGFAYVHLKEVLELVSLTGTIAEYQSKPSIHCHMTVASGREGGRVYSGHLLGGAIVYSTAEVVLAEVAGLRMTRQVDPEIKTPQLAPLPMNEGGSTNQ